MLQFRRYSFFSFVGVLPFYLTLISLISPSSFVWFLRFALFLHLATSIFSQFYYFVELILFLLRYLLRVLSASFWSCCWMNYSSYFYLYFSNVLAFCMLFSLYFSVRLLRLTLFFSHTLNTLIYLHCATLLLLLCFIFVSQIFVCSNRIRSVRCAATVYNYPDRPKFFTPIFTSNLLYV